MKYSASSVWENKDEYDVVVVGAGYAGCEAALATARLGFKTVIFTVSVDSIALMPCNPNIGGSFKGTSWSESWMRSAGRWEKSLTIHLSSLRCSTVPKVLQCIRCVHRRIRQITANNASGTAEPGESGYPSDGSDRASGRRWEDHRCTDLFRGAIYRCKAKAVFLYRNIFKGTLHLRRISTYTGPNGLQSANYLTDSLKALGIKMYRFKTGTPARIDKNTIDFTKMEEQFGDEGCTVLLFYRPGKCTDRSGILLADLYKRNNA